MKRYLITYEVAGYAGKRHKGERIVLAKSVVNARGKFLADMRGVYRVKNVKVRLVRGGSE